MKYRLSPENSFQTNPYIPLKEFNRHFPYNPTQKISQTWHISLQMPDDFYLFCYHEDAIEALHTVKMTNTLWMLLSTLMQRCQYSKLINLMVDEARTIQGWITEICKMFKKSGYFQGGHHHQTTPPQFTGFLA